MTERQTELFVEGVAAIARASGRSVDATFQLICEVNECDPQFAPPTYKVAVQRAWDQAPD